MYVHINFEIVLYSYAFIYICMYIQTSYPVLSYAIHKDHVALKSKEHNNGSLIYTYTYIYPHTHTNTHTHARTHAHTHTHTHTLNCSVLPLPRMDHMPFKMGRNRNSKSRPYTRACLVYRKWS